MSTPVTVTKATISMEEGLILRWLKAEGDSIAKDEALFEMETDKAIVEVASPESGMLLKILVADGPVKVDDVVGWIGEPGEIIGETGHAPPAVAQISHPTPQLESPQARNPSPPARIVSTPAARRRAAELGIALESVRSSSPGGRIAQEDVERAAADRKAPGLVNRKTLIDRLTTTWQSVPHIHIARHLDAAGLREGKKRLAETPVSVTDLLLWTLARVLPLFPELCMVWDGDRLIPAAEINLALAVDTPRGVVAPVISSANALGLRELSRRRRELVEAAENRRLRPEDLEGGVFTLTNLGMEGVDFFAPLINAPQTAILATGKMDQAPIVVDGAPAVGWRMWVNLALDHRVSDGMAAARFLSRLQDEVRKLPEELSAHL